MFLLLSAALLAELMLLLSAGTGCQATVKDQNLTAITQIYFLSNQRSVNRTAIARIHYACYNWAMDQTGF